MEPLLFILETEVSFVYRKSMIKTYSTMILNIKSFPYGQMKPPYFYPYQIGTF